MAKESGGDASSLAPKSEETPGPQLRSTGVVGGMEGGPSGSTTSSSSPKPPIAAFSPTRDEEDIHDESNEVRQCSKSTDGDNSRRFTKESVETKEFDLIQQHIREGHRRLNGDDD